MHYRYSQHRRHRSMRRYIIIYRVYNIYTLHANTVRISAYSTHVHTCSSGGTTPSVLRRFNLRLVHSALAHELPVSAPPHSAISFQRIMLGIKHTNTIAECSQMVGYGSQCRHDFGSLLKLLYPLIPLARSGAAGKEQTEKFLSSHRYRGLGRKNLHEGGTYINFILTALILCHLCSYKTIDTYSETRDCCAMAGSEEMSMTEFRELKLERQKEQTSIYTSLVKQLPAKNSPRYDQ